MENLYSPVLLFVYNRPWHTRKTVEALKGNLLADESDLIIYAEGAKHEEDLPHVRQVREDIHSVSGFRSILIVERTKNWGCANNIIDGISSVLNTHGRVIVLEDDILTSPYFLRYMNMALDFYRETPQIFSLSGYNHPASLMQIPAGYHHDVYFCSRSASWGWGTWLDRWQNVDWEIKDFNAFLKDRRAQSAFNQSGDDLSDMLVSQMKGAIDAWDIRWTYHHYKKGGSAVWPVLSYTDNIGHDGSGTHCSPTRMYENDLSKAVKEPVFLKDIMFDKRILKNFRQVYQRGPITRLKKLLRLA